MTLLSYSFISHRIHKCGNEAFVKGTSYFPGHRIIRGVFIQWYRYNYRIKNRMAKCHIEEHRGTCIRFGFSSGVGLDSREVHWVCKANFGISHWYSLQWKINILIGGSSTKRPLQLQLDGHPSRYQETTTDWYDPAGATNNIDARPFVVWNMELLTEVGIAAFMACEIQHILFFSHFQEDKLLSRHSFGCFNEIGETLIIWELIPEKNYEKFLKHKKEEAKASVIIAMELINIYLY